MGSAAAATTVFDTHPPSSVTLAEVENWSNF